MRGSVWRPPPILGALAALAIAATALPWGAPVAVGCVVASAFWYGMWEARRLYRRPPAPPPEGLPARDYKIKFQTIPDGGHMLIITDSELRWALECAPVWAGQPWTPTGRDGWTTVRSTGRIMVQVKGVEP